MQTYSFLDFQCVLTGPGGIVLLGSGSAAAEEGVSVEFLEETDIMKVGADGNDMHSLNANKSGKVTVRLLKTSPVNGQLMVMYNLQRASAATHGKNTLILTHTVTGDVYTCQHVAFAKGPANSYAKEAAAIEWDFNAGKIDALLGLGL